MLVLWDRSYIEILGPANEVIEAVGDQLLEIRLRVFSETPKKDVCSSLLIVRDKLMMIRSEGSTIPETVSKVWIR